MCSKKKTHSFMKVFCMNEHDFLFCKKSTQIKVGMLEFFILRSYCLVWTLLHILFLKALNWLIVVGFFTHFSPGASDFYYIRRLIRHNINNFIFMKLNYLGVYNSTVRRNAFLFLSKRHPRREKTWCNASNASNALNEIV